VKPGASEPGKPLARGMGSTKKLAEQDAARRALDKLTKTGKAAINDEEEPPAE